jgi:hypothetical protein
MDDFFGLGEPLSPEQEAEVSIGEQEAWQEAFRLVESNDTQAFKSANPRVLRYMQEILILQDE